MVSFALYHPRHLETTHTDMNSLQLLVGILEYSNIPLSKGLLDFLAKKIGPGMFSILTPFFSR